MPEGAWAGVDRPIHPASPGMVTLGPDAVVLDPPLATARHGSHEENPPPQRDRPHTRSEPAERRKRWITLAALAAVTAFGAWLRTYGLSGLGLWRDDAWVALSAHVGIGEAWRMWVTAPGAYFIDRTVLVLSPGTTTWAQLPALVAGVAAIPAVYALIRYFRFSRLAALLGASAIALAPLCVVYSTRVKEYELDLLLTCAVLAAGELARRTPGRRQLAVLVVVSVLAFLCSASLAAVIVGVWVALAVHTWRGLPQSWPRRVVLAVVAVAAGCGAVGLVFYRAISLATHRLWTGAFISHQSVGAFISSLGSVVRQLLANAVDPGALSAPTRVVLVVLWLVIAVIGLASHRSMLAPALAVVCAVVASAAQVEPLGTGRTDQYLYPALLLLTVAGATRVCGAVVRKVRRRPRRQVVALALAGLVVGVLALGYGAAHAWSERTVYPGVDARALAAQIHRHEQPGDHVFVSELMRFPWALAEEPRPDLRFGSGWATGFTVLSTDPRVFIVPSEYYEADAHPRAWANAMSGYHRLWYVWSPPLAVDPSYRALRADGWQPRTVLRAPGAMATLLVRP